MPDNKILQKMLDRLFAALVNGPSLNCRPHASRQRIDLSQSAKLQDLSPEESLRHLLGPEREAKVTARVAMPPRRPDSKHGDGDGQEQVIELTEGEKQAAKAWQEQDALLRKLRTVADDAKTYEQDTGVHVLNLGFPLLSLPPGTQRGMKRRIIAPIAFIPVTLTVKSGSVQSIQLACRGAGSDLVMPNTALLAWLEQQTGTPAKELFADQEGEEPWREIRDIVQYIASMVQVQPPELFATGGPEDPGTKLALEPAPRTEELQSKPMILTAAVLGLFPMANQGLLRDMQAMAGGEALAGPVESFVRLEAALEPAAPAAEAPAAPAAHQRRKRRFADERLVTAADPCQSRAVRLARQSKGLVVHGPPGTGKSQTIANIIGDHLVRGERVLLVCDKRTALDVVANRMQHMGLGDLCALIHDPQRDQRDLYKSVRDQLENLTLAKSDAYADGQVQRIDQELQKLHDELTASHSALMDKDPRTGHSFHDLMGQWLSIPADAAFRLEDGTVATVELEQLEPQVQRIDETLKRGCKVDFPNNPWTSSANIGLGEFLARPMDVWRQRIAACVQSAQEADLAADAAIPPFQPQAELAQQAELRGQLAQRLAQVCQQTEPAIVQQWSKAADNERRRALDQLSGAEKFAEGLQTPLDLELAATLRAQPTTLAAVAQQLLALDGYLDIARSWMAFVHFGRKSRARAAMAPWGLQLAPDQAQRLRNFLAGLRARMLLTELLRPLCPQEQTAGLWDDARLGRLYRGHKETLELWRWIEGTPPLRDMKGRTAAAMTDAAAMASLVQGLEKSAPRAAAIETFLATIKSAELFDAKWQAEARSQLCSGQALTPTIQKLAGCADTLEGVLRIRAALTELLPPLSSATAQLLKQSATHDAGVSVIRRGVLAGEIGRRLKASPQLQAIDSHRLQSCFERYRSLEDQKRALVRAAILHCWTSRQRERLLASTGTRLSSLGADLRRRLTMRGERAMRLRQVVAVGREIEGGDPLFDLRPVWMASPETVAQVFDRKPIFDVVVFDEASQCRLEEALPVIIRGKRLVVAGDQKQLPPTRFFESAIAASEDDELETDQDLFESQQGEIEDLLSAALNLEIEECYLDVHYRSRNADLIQFSNEQFYGSRLQAIPGHPANRTRYAPLTLHAVKGVYDDRQNKAEAEEICRLVKDLLSWAKPPSIGIACFNLQQRDLIVDKLDELAGEDEVFATRLAAARSRQGEGSFEGLFVKNLENVQGDERDHIIISTTYGPDAQGRFYRRFGPLGRQGGGRRLNVLVTRARHEVHLVTSIPPEIYRSIPPVPPGQTPGGGWLLFAYLHYAETLAGIYEKVHQALAEAKVEEKPTVNVLPARNPSMFSESLAGQLAAAQNTGSDVHWGNDGFCVDLALHHPTVPEDVTVGILCDGARFDQAEDPVEWDIFRTGIHESQGWKLHRLWTPHFFRDPQGSMRSVMADVTKILAEEKDRDALQVTGAKQQ